MEVGCKERVERAYLYLCGSLLISLAGVVPVASDQKQQVVVVSVSGEWTLVRQNPQTGGTLDAPSSRPVRFGQTLTVGDLCLLGDDEASIVLKYSTPSDDTLYPFPCDKGHVGGSSHCAARPGKPCTIDLRNLNASKGIVASLKAGIWDPILRSISNQPERYMVAGTRGAEAELADAVVPLDNDQVDLRAIFRDMSPGTYYVALSSVQLSSSPGSPVRVAYATGEAARIAAAGLRPGMYKVLQVTEKGEPGDSDCWVLVSALPDFAAQSGAYSQAAREAEKLPSEMDRAATRALLRAYLESLSRAKQVAQP